MDNRKPFKGSVALRRRDVTRNDLRRRFRRIHNDVYLHRDAELTAAARAEAAWLWAGPEAVLAGVSAAAVLGTKWLDAQAPAELVRTDRHCPDGVTIRTYDLAPDDIGLRKGMRVTTAARTAFDIGRTVPMLRAIPVLDALLNATGCKAYEIAKLADSRPGFRGVRKLRVALGLVDGGAESPQESRVRLILVGAGLPGPETQIEFFDEYGEAFIRVDMGWREWKVAVEYDGVQHWTDPRQRAWDIERIAILEAMGWVVIRVSAVMLARPGVIIERVQSTLRAAGCPI